MFQILNNIVDSKGSVKCLISQPDPMQPYNAMSKVQLITVDRRKEKNLINILTSTQIMEAQQTRQ